MARLSASQLPPFRFSLVGMCCPGLEAWLFQHRYTAIFVGCIFYLPLLLTLELVWFGSVILTIIINLLIIVVCKPCRKLLNCNASPAPRDKKQFGVMLNTSGCLRTSHQVASSEPSEDSDLMRLNINKDKKTEISILSFNVFGDFGKFWQRYPLLVRVFNEHPADIICIQECITTNIWRFGTLQTLKEIDAAYNGFFVSIREMYTAYHPILFRYSFLWPIISELQLILQAHFGLPFWKELLWTAILGGNWIARYAMLLLTGAATHFGNAIVFGNGKPLKYQSFIMLPGDRCAVRALYDMTQEGGKRVWIVCVHLSCEEEQNSFYATDRREDDLESAPSSIGIQQCEVMLKWMSDAQTNLVTADSVIICGDFNASPKTNVYRYMQEQGYKSVMFEKLGYEPKTHSSGTWTCCELGNLAKESITYDYIWVKRFVDEDDDDDEKQQDAEEHVKSAVVECQMVGMDFIEANDGSNIHASDHLGIYIKLLV